MLWVVVLLVAGGLVVVEVLVFVPVDLQSCLLRAGVAAYGKVVVWGVGNVILVVVLVVRSIVFGDGWGVVVFSRFRGFGVQRVLGIVEYFVGAIFNGYLVVGCVVVFVGLFL